jgi:outer membrane receptor protein involved in Fe transport
LYNNRFKAKIGVDIVIDAGVKTKAHLYPVAELKYSMFNDIFIPYAGLRGGLKQTTFKSLTADNEFILPNVALRNENTAIDVYGGIKGTLSKRMSFNLSASFARVQNKALFVTDTTFSVGNKFNLLYDTLNLTTIEGSLSYQLNEKLKIDGIGRFYSYGLLNNTYAWNLPQWQAIARGSYNLFDKFLVNLDLNFEGGRKALVYAMEEDVTVENNQFAKSLGLVADINLGLEYRYNKRLSAFIQMNNLASQRYNRWYNYPVQIFQFMGGVTARF